MTLDSCCNPLHENRKSQEFTVKVPTLHGLQMSSEFQMQTPPRLSSQTSSTHISPVTPKDFRLTTPTTATSPQLSQNKLSSVTKSPSSPKFQRLPTSCAAAQVPQLAKISQMQQVSLCGQSALQQRQLGQLQASGLLQPLPSAACQAQQVQASQCPHFQNKQLVQQRIDQLQLMQHAGQLSAVEHGPHNLQKQTPVQFKKCSTTQQVTKMTDSEQIQQAAQLAQNQHLLANQQMQKLIQIRQNAIAASGVASQLALGNTVPVQGSSKTVTQCFQSQLAAARQAAAAAQLPSSQRSQGTSYNLSSHDTSGHQFFPPSMHPSQDQTSCPHPSFTSQSMTDFNSNAPSYPTIRLSTETNDGLEDLEQFLLENMPWREDQAASHGLAQQGGNRPSSADSLTLTIPSQVPSQNRAGIGGKSKASITRPKPRKPVSAPGSKNLLGNLGRGVKKKSCPKKKPLDTECIVSKSEGFCQTNIIMPASHALHLMPKQTEKGTNINFLEPKQMKDNATNETDSSDSVQCINITHNALSKTASMGVSFSNFTPTVLCASEKTATPMCHVDPTSSKDMYDISSKNNFLDQCNLVSKNSTNLDQSKNISNLNFNGTGHSSGIAFESSEKDSNNYKNYAINNSPQIFSKKSKSSVAQDIFLGQRNSEDCDINNDGKRQLIIPNSHTITPFGRDKSMCDLKSHSSVNEEKNTKSHVDHFLGKNELVHKSSNNCEELKTPEQSSDIVKCNTPSQEKTVEKYENSKEKCLVDSDSKKSLDSDILGLDKPNSISSKDDNTESTNSSFLKTSSCFRFLEKSASLNEPDNVSSCEKLKENMPEVLNLLVKNIPVTDAEKLSKICDEKPSQKVNSLDTNSADINEEKLNHIEEKVSLPKADQDPQSDHENMVLNDENHFSKENDPDNSSCEQTVKRIALRIRKSADSANKLNDGDKSVKYYVSEKTTDDIKLPVIKKSSQKKKKCKQENHKFETVKNDGKKMVCNKFISESEVQENNVTNIEKSFIKDKDINGNSLPPCYNEIENNVLLENEVHEDEFCMNKQIHENGMDEIPVSRLRLRDTPKTSVKRTCPCCVDSQEPKKCREIGTGNFAKVTSSLKGKSTLKARNTANGHSDKVNTRSSTRLRSRNTPVN